MRQDILIRHAVQSDDILRIVCPGTGTQAGHWQGSVTGSSCVSARENIPGAQDASSSKHIETRDICCGPCLSGCSYPR